MQMDNRKTCQVIGDLLLADLNEKHPGIEHTFDIGAEAYGTIDLTISSHLTSTNTIHATDIQIPQDNVVQRLSRHRQTIIDHEERWGK